jgi:hypothetical protein
MNYLNQIQLFISMQQKTIWLFSACFEDQSLRKTHAVINTSYSRRISCYGTSTYVLSAVQRVMEVLIWHEMKKSLAWPDCKTGRITGFDHIFNAVSYFILLLHFHSVDKSSSIKGYR